MSKLLLSQKDTVFNIEITGIVVVTTEEFKVSSSIQETTFRQHSTGSIIGITTSVSLMTIIIICV